MEGIKTTVHISHLILFMYRYFDRHKYCLLFKRLIFLTSIRFYFFPYTYVLFLDTNVNIHIVCSSKLRVHCPMHISLWNGMDFTATLSSTYVKIMSSIGVQPSPWLLNKSFQRPSRILYNTMGCPCLILIWENKDCLHMTLYCFGTLFVFMYEVYPNSCLWILGHIYTQIVHPLLYALHRLWGWSFHGGLFRWDDSGCGR